MRQDKYHAQVSVLQEPSGNMEHPEDLRERRQQDYVDNLCRKLFAYALGRGLLPSDQPALDEMRARLAADDYAFGSLVESIVTSPQFLNRRGREGPRAQ